MTDIQRQINTYLASLPSDKQQEMQALHTRISVLPVDKKMWFFDGRNEAGKIVTNPNIGYGKHTFSYADKTTREFYRVGLSANSGGISIYVMGIEDKDFLSATYGHRIGKAAFTGYCIKFKRLTDIDVDVLLEAIEDALRLTS